jgi:stearoyl-CoA desaturase (delta-9 desaturase)
MAPKGNTTVDEELTADKPDICGVETYDEPGVKYHKLTTDPNYKHKIIPHMVIIFALLHAAALYGFYLIITFRIMLISFIYGTFVGIASAQGIVLGAHRGFSHNAFKLTTSGQALFIMLHTITGQNNLYWWVRDHRLHHKFCDTDADPYNAKRGFYFSHIGWLMSYKHPLVHEKGKTIDMSDMESNKLFMFQKKYYTPMFLLVNVIITLIPVYCWNEDFWVSFFTCFAYRLVHVLNSTWCINSVAHLYGTRPFDTRITARQSRFAHILTFGDGWHNYHHVFPWDPAVSEFGYEGGISTNLLYFLHGLGIAYDLKKPSPTVVYNHYKKYGDTSLSDKDFSFKSKELST